MAKMELVFSSKGYNNLTKQLMVNAIDTDPYIKEELSFILKPSDKQVNDHLDIKYSWKKLNKDKLNMLLGFLFFIPYEEYKLVDETNDRVFGVYEEKSQDFIPHTPPNFALQSKINRERKEKEKSKQSLSLESQLANFINKCK
jgi:hypothetical protein